MATTKKGPSDVSKYEFSISYDGKALAADQHSIDVQTLAPALLAFGKLIREANQEFNAKRATANVLVVSDFEHKCFNINFEVVVGIYEQVKTLLGSEPVETAKKILEWLGLIGVGSSGTIGFLQYLKWKNGRRVAEVKTLGDIDRSGMVEVKVEGENNSVQIHNHVYHLSENPRALRATRDAFLPLGDEGFDTVKVREDDKVVEEINWEEVKAIVASCNVGIEAAKEIEPEVDTVTAWLSVYSPVFDQSAPSWRFRLGKDVIYADISATQIAAQAMARGEVAVDDSYLVRLEITTPLTPDGKRQEPQHKVLEVLRFVPAGPALKQTSLFDDKEP